MAPRASDESLHPQVVRAAVATARRAPSAHNAQPWSFVQDGPVLQLRADRSRRLPVVDPDDRELVISCGAALAHLELALQNLGFAPDVTLTPDPDDEDLLARLVLPSVGAGHGARRHEMQAVTERRTNREQFEARDVPVELLPTLQAQAEEDGVLIVPLDAGAPRTALADLVGAGDRIQLGDPAFRRELASWVHPDRSQARDGIRAGALGLGGSAALLGRLVVRSPALPGRQARLDRELTTAAPLVVALLSRSDGTRDRLATGRALSRLLLTAAFVGVSADFLNQPVEVPALRSELSRLLGAPGTPQLLLRLGHGPPVPRAVRRTVDEVLTVVG